MGRPEPASSLTRREFLAASGLLVTGVVSGCATASIYRVALSNGRVRVDQKHYPELVPSGGMIQLRVGDMTDPVILVRQGDAYQAFSAVCTHQGCSVRPSGHSLVCPCHGSTFNLEGLAVRGPAEQPLTRYRTEVSADGIEIYIR